MPVLRSLLLTLAALSLPLVPLHAQQTELLPDTIRTLISEVQGLQARLDSTQARALEENPDLQERRREIERYVTDVMLQADPAMEQKLERLPQLQQDLVDAQQAQDTARLRTVVQEGRQLQSELNQVRAEAMEQEDVQERITDFRRDLLAAMESVDPEVDALVDRMETLARKLQTFQAGG